MYILRNFKIQISKGLKKCKIFYYYLQSCYTETNKTLAHIHTLKNFKTAVGVTKQNKTYIL